jgi:Ca2+-binding EF-hand superfamily protein
MLHTKLNKALVVAMALGCGMAMGQTAFAQSTAQSTPNTQPTPNLLHPQSLQSNGMSSGKAGNDTQRSRVWQSIDADHDGSVSRDEYMDHCNKMFVKLDADKNGMVSQSEWQTGMMKMPGSNTGNAGMNHAEMGQSGAGGDQKASSTMNHSGMEHRGMDHEWSAMDPDHKGSVSKPDFSAHCTKTFDKMDTNGDGKLSQQEWRQGMQQWQSGGSD